MTLTAVAEIWSLAQGEQVLVARFEDAEGRSFELPITKEQMESILSFYMEVRGAAAREEEEPDPPKMSPPVSKPRRQKLPARPRVREEGDTIRLAPVADEGFTDEDLL